MSTLAKEIKEAVDLHVEAMKEGAKSATITIHDGDRSIALDLHKEGKKPLSHDNQALFREYSLDVSYMQGEKFLGGAYYNLEFYTRTSNLPKLCSQIREGLKKP